MPESEITLYRLAYEACQKHDDIERAISAVLERINDNDELRAALLENMVRSAVSTAVYSARHTQRGALKFPTAGRCTRTPEAIREAAAVSAKTILRRWILPDGRSLGQARGAELLALARHEQALSAGHQRNAAFYQRVGEQAGNKLVSKAMKSEAVWSLWRNVCDTIKVAV